MGYHFFVRIFFKLFFSQTKMKILLCFALCCFLLNYRIESGNAMTLPAGGQDAPKRASVGCKLFWVELCRNAISAPIERASAGCRQRGGHCSTNKDCCAGRCKASTLRGKTTKLCG